MSGDAVSLNVREVRLVISGLTMLLRELEQQEDSLSEVRDRQDGSLSADAASWHLDQVAALETEVALLQERLIDTVHLAGTPDDDWPEELASLFDS